MKKAFILGAFMVAFVCSAWAAPYDEAAQYKRIPADSVEGQKIFEQIHEFADAAEKIYLEHLDLADHFFLVRKADNEELGSIMLVQAVDDEEESGENEDGDSTDGGGTDGENNNKEDEPDFKPVPPDPDETHPGLKDDPLPQRWSYNLRKIMEDFFPDEREKPALQWLLGGAEAAGAGYLVWYTVTSGSSAASLALRILPPVLAGTLAASVVSRVYLWKSVERNPGLFPLFTMLKKSIDRMKNPPTEKYPDYPREKEGKEDQQPDLPFTHL